MGTICRIASAPDVERDVEGEAERFWLSCSALRNAVAGMLCPATPRTCNRIVRNPRSPVLGQRPLVYVRAKGWCADVRGAEAGTSLMWHGMVFGWFQELVLVFFYTLLCRTWMGRECGISRTLEQRTAEGHVTHAVWHVPDCAVSRGVTTLSGYRPDMYRGRGTRQEAARVWRMFETSKDGELSPWPSARTTPRAASVWRQPYWSERGGAVGADIADDGGTGEWGPTLDRAHRRQLPVGVGLRDDDGQSTRPDRPDP